MIPTYEEVMKPHKEHFEKHGGDPNCEQCMKYIDMKEALE